MSLKKINELATKLGSVNIMEVCGGHTNSIIRNGIRDAMPKNINLISGPGCPVCVTTQKEIDEMINLALNGVPVATYADMIRVPGTKMSLEEARENGADIKAVYSATEVLDDKNRVFFGIGFETTTPMTAKLLENDIAVYSAHKLIPPGLLALSTDKRVNIDALILPGHVAVIIGEQEFPDLNVPQVITGFEPENILESIKIILDQLVEGKKEIVNNYKGVVTKTGNGKAQKIINENFKVVDSDWRGLGTIPSSGLEPKDDNLNAKIKYKDILGKTITKELPGCRCAEVIIGQIRPSECQLFGKVCTPKNPRGACMVSEEGACQIYHANRN
ncbi:hydrogenase formation protein HypD [Candidatus Woesearchaeota archaeon]|nr:MAG: hydrogenase formation protein HypD [Candidatus Woesearchaeota archaeon]